MGAPECELRRTHCLWLRSQGIVLPDTHLYAAPQYLIEAEGPVDAKLLELIETLKPQHIIVGIGGGSQEPLGADLKGRLSYQPAIHCIGAAIGFLTGEQVRIPSWADRCYLGWLFRTLQNPRRFGRRYWEARRLFHFLRVYRERSPVSFVPVLRKVESVGSV